jgi:hypothetical protein
MNMTVNQNLCEPNLRSAFEAYNALLGLCVYGSVYVCVLVCVCLCASVMHMWLVEPFWFVLLVDVVVIKMIEVV